MINDEKFFQALINASPNVVLMHRLGKIEYIDGALESILGYKSEDVIGRSVIDYVHPGDQATTVENIRLRLTGKKVPGYEIRIRSKDGSYIPVLCQSEIVGNPSDQIVLVILANLSTIKKAERQLADSEERFRNITHAVQEAIVLINSRDLIQFWNDSAERILGFTSADALGISLEKLIGAQPRGSDGAVSVSELLAKYARIGSTARLEMRCSEYSAVCKDGRKIFIELTPSGFNLRGEWHAIAVIRDITDRVSAETEQQEIRKRMVQAEKLASIGTLASGIAHEINNPLAIVAGFAGVIRDVLKGKDQLDDAVAGALAKQERAIKRIADIVNGLRTYARMDTDHIENADLHRIVQDTLSLLGYIYKKEEIEVILEFKSTHPYIKGNVGKLQQVVMNFLANARDAFENCPAPHLIRISTADDGENVVLTIADTGCGISRENQAKIFDAFFTTKVAGKGTGLGLAISLSIVHSMRGRIEVDSEPGRGTAFRLVFPKAEGVANMPQTDTEGVPYQLNAKVLIVDDEADVRELVRRHLGQFGCVVDEAHDGVEALGKVLNGRFDLVISDLKMPLMGGEILIREIKNRAKPAPKTIVITGGIITAYTQEERQAVRAMADGYLLKPFSRESLYQAVRECLERPATPA